MKQSRYMNTAKKILAIALGIFLITGCGNSSATQSIQEKVTIAENVNSKDSTLIIYFAGGCFWGTEHFFKQVNGVTATEVGFANGHTENPTYKDVISEETGYAETVKVTYDPKTL